MCRGRADRVGSAVGASRRLINSGDLVSSLGIPTRAATVPSGYSTDVPKMTFLNLRKDVLLDRAKKAGRV